MEMEVGTMTPETQIVLQTIMDLWMCCAATLIIASAIQLYQDIKGDK